MGLDLVALSDVLISLSEYTLLCPSRSRGSWAEFPTQWKYEPRVEIKTILRRQLIIGHGYNYFADPYMFT